jgi:hypothetical protein
MDFLWWRYGGLCHWVWGFGFNGINSCDQSNMRLVKWIDENEGQEAGMDVICTNCSHEVSSIFTFAGMIGSNGIIVEDKK